MIGLHFQKLADFLGKIAGFFSSTLGRRWAAHVTVLHFQCLFSPQEAHITRKATGLCGTSRVLVQCDSTTCLLSAVLEQGNDVLRGNTNDPKDRSTQIISTDFKTLVAISCFRVHGSY